MENDKKSKPCFYMVGDIEKITRVFLKKGFIQEKNPSKGAIRSFIYKLGKHKRLHIRLFEEAESKYICYGHTEPPPLADPLFHLKGAIVGSVTAQKAINVMIGVTKIAAGMMEQFKPNEEIEELTEEDKKTKENIEIFQKISDSIPYLPEKKQELADYDEGCKILRDFFPEYIKK